MKTITAIKTNDKVSFYEVSNCINNKVVQFVKPQSYVIKDDIILITDDLNKLAMALSTITNGLEDNITLTKEYVVMNIVPLLKKMCQIFNINYYSSSGKKYLCLDSSFLIAQKNKLFYIDVFLNVYEIEDYITIGNNANAYRIALYNANPSEYEAAILATQKSLMQCVAGYPNEVRYINTIDMKEEIMYANCN